jgi:DNA-binding MarR family transcriptional regulator
MAQDVTADQVVETARGLDRTEFTRDDLADRLGVKKQDLKGAIKQARQSGRLEKVRDDDEGKGRFRVTD